MINSSLLRYTAYTKEGLSRTMVAVRPASLNYSTCSLRLCDVVSYENTPAIIIILLLYVLCLVLCVLCSVCFVQRAV